MGLSLYLQPLSTYGVWLVLPHLTLKKILGGTALLFHSGQNGSLVSLGHTVHGEAKIQMDLTRFICSCHDIVQPQFSRRELHDPCGMRFLSSSVPCSCPCLEIRAERQEEAIAVVGRDRLSCRVEIQTKKPFLDIAQDKTISPSTCTKWHFM